MKTILIIMVIMVIMLIPILIFYIILNRINNVSNFRIKMIDEDYKTYLKLPSFRRMVFSFKRLTKENWIKENLK